MTTFFQTVRRLVRRRDERETTAAHVPEPERRLPVTAPAIEIAPNDPIIAYFLSVPGAVELEKLRLESPALAALHVAGVKVVVPLVSQSDLIGLLSLGPRMSQQEYSSDDRGLLNNLATQAAPAVRVAQLVRQQQLEALQRERIEQELRVAQLVQQTLLPKTVPSLAGYRIDRYYQPARAVGGDFYDFIALPDARMGLIIGDVTDKGVPAALVMATTRSLLRAAAGRLESPGLVLARVNEVLCDEIPPNMFVTCLYAILDPLTGVLRFANAGHDLPYRYHRGGVDELRARGMPLGLMPGMQYEENELTLAPGERILFYSDGIVEARNWEKIAYTTHGPLRLPRHLFALAHFGLRAIWPARGLAEVWFRGDHARGIFGGLAVHSILPLERAPSAATGLVLAALGHAYGWPLPRGGSQKVADALASYLRGLGGEIVTGERIETLAQLPPARAILFDVMPRQLLRIAGDRLPPRYQRALRRYRYGPGVFKVDWALDGPIPWRAPECARAATVHIGGTLPEIAESERAAWQGRHTERPFVLLAQQSLFDGSRAPAGKHTAWAYCHVPHGSTCDMTARIEAQIERCAPGFRDRILARSILGPAAMQAHNANYIGGDINGGVQDFFQLYTRPAISLNPYKTAAKGIYICSSSTPPGGGVHGLCGYFAAQAALRDDP